MQEKKWIWKKTRLSNLIKERLKYTPLLSQVNKIKGYGNKETLMKRFLLGEKIAHKFDYDEQKDHTYLKMEIEDIKALEEYDEVCVSEYKEDYSYIDFIPSNTSLLKPNELSYDQYRIEYEEMLLFKPSSFNRGSLYLIKHIQDLYYNALNPMNANNESVKAMLTSDYNKLKNYLECFLGTKYERNPVTGDTLLFGQNINSLSLSAGQSILVQISVKMFFLLSKSGDDHIVFY